MSDLLSRLNSELSRVAREVQQHEKDARGLLTLKSGLEAVDIYAHPETLMWFRRELEPFVQFKIDDPKRMPPGAIGKYHDCWVFSDVEQPQGALIIRHKGRVYADVPIHNNPSTDRQERD